MKLDRVLVPLDGSPLAERALSTACALLRERPAATLILVRAAQAAVGGPWTDPIETQFEVVDEAKSYLAAVAARLRDEAPGRSVKTSVWYGAPASSIVDAAEACRAHLIVMSTHGRTGLRRVVVGSVAESVLRAARTPVLLVPAGATDSEAAALAPSATHGEEVARV